MSPGFIIGGLIVIALFGWIVAQTIRYERTKRREGKEAADGEAAAKDEAVARFLETEGGRHRVLYHILTGLVFTAAGVWLSVETWQNIDAIEAGSRDSTSVFPGTELAYRWFGALGAKLVMPAVTLVYLAIWFASLRRMLSTASPAEGQHDTEETGP